MGNIRGTKHLGAILRFDWYSLEIESMMYSSFDEVPESLLDALSEAYHASINAEIILAQEGDYRMCEVPRSFVTASGLASIRGDDE